MFISPKSVTKAALTASTKLYAVWNDPKTQATCYVALAIISSMAGAYALAIGGLIHTITGLGLLGNATVVFNSRHLATLTKLISEVREENLALNKENATLKESVKELSATEKRLNTALTTLQALKAELEHQVSTFEDENTRLTETVSRLEKLMPVLSQIKESIHEWLPRIKQAIADNLEAAQRNATNAKDARLAATEHLKAANTHELSAEKAQNATRLLGQKVAQLCLLLKIAQIGVKARIPRPNTIGAAKFVR
ncbi:MAG: hypothetical protein P0S95_00460 [Rhabdochlamydiaceae bacterium]|nr:hypothetical protein [Candidatus Amphrikana amoebophyrae]